MSDQTLRALCRLSGPRPGSNALRVGQTFKASRFGWLPQDVALAEARRQVEIVAEPEPDPDPQPEPKAKPKPADPPPGD